MFLENWNQHFQEVNQPGKLNREQCACQNQPIFASIIVCNLKFRSLIHFQFIFTYDGRKCFNFTLLHVANQFFQHQLQKTLSFPYCMFCFFYHRLIGHMLVVYFWAPYSVLLICVIVFLCQYYPVLITVVLQYSLKSGSQ